MKIVLVNAPDAEMHAQHVTAIKQLLHELCGRQGYGYMVLPGDELPGAFNFFKRRKQERAIRELHPDLLIYSSPKNLLTVKGIRTMVLLTAAGDSLTRNAALKLTGVITDSAYIKKQLTQSTGIAAARVCAVQLYDDSDVESNAQQIRDELTGGKEYFFYGGDINSESRWERVLQAFSQFKKWQQSGLQLVLAGNIEATYGHIFQQKFEAYKYRHDVICLDPVETSKRKKLATAAFSVLSTADFFEERMDIINAFHAGIPVIAASAGISKDLCGECALYADFNNAKELSIQMIAVYKNEAMHNHLAEKGRLVSSRFSRRQSLEQLHHCINAAANSEFS
jgi:glycosyltransferase involved in cell wall biosynthesis